MPSTLDNILTILSPPTPKLGLVEAVFRHYLNKAASIVSADSVDPEVADQRIKEAESKRDFNLAKDIRLEFIYYQLLLDMGYATKFADEKGEFSIIITQKGIDYLNKDLNEFKGYIAIGLRDLVVLIFGSAIGANVGIWFAKYFLGN